MLVGDIILAIREGVTDMPPALATPTITSATGTSAVGGTITPGTYYFVLTVLNQWGESLPSAEVSVVVGGGQNAITFNISGGVGITSLRLYSSGSPGVELGAITPPAAASFTVLSLAPTINAPPPTHASGYFPDADGDSFSASSVFVWLNDALILASQICGGLIDYSGVTTAVGQPMYVVTGEWKTIPDVWYDGYPLAPDRAGNFFRRNAITASVLSMVATTLLTDRMMIEVWPQPARTAASSTLFAGLTPTSTVAAPTSLTGFLLTNGMIQIDQEIIAYNGMSGGAFQNLIRGLGGTTAASHVPGAPVTELNLFFRGWRKYNPTFIPGQSALSIPIPPEWKPMLPIYGLARTKLAEQNIQEYNELKKDFEGSLTAWMKTTKITTGPRQIGDPSNNLEVIPSLGGGWVVPGLFAVNYGIESEYRLLNHVLGASPWTQSIFICCAILEMALFAMWARPIIQPNGKRITLADLLAKVYAAMDGFRNFVRIISVRSLKLSRNAPETVGESVSGFGSRITVGFATYSTRDLEEKSSVLQVGKFIWRWVRSGVAFLARKKPSGVFQKASADTRSVLKQELSYGRPIKHNLAIPKRVPLINRAWNLGGRTFPRTKSSASSKVPNIPAGMASE